MPENNAPGPAIHRQGDEWLVAFVYDRKRYSLGLFQSRKDAEHAYGRKLTALTTAAAGRAMRTDGSGSRGAVVTTRAKDGHVAAEGHVPVAMLARLVRYCPLTGAMTPRPKAHGRGRYLVVEVAGARLYAHRVAWALANGAWPARRLRCLGHEVDMRAANWRMAGDAERA